jgi:dipeptidyl aminopeptidase/acylaminoacyl peptidase
MAEHKHVFTSEGLTCSASLFLPVNEQPPVVILGQGFGAERTFGTGGFVKAFVEAGWAVFSFDYRSFGDSEGRPRQLVNPHHHCEDWYNVVQYVRSLQNIDNQRVVLWGSSFAGGHVLVTAARVSGLAGVIAQVPFCSSRSTAKNTSIAKTIKSGAHACLDGLLSLIGSEHRVALIAKPDAGFAIMDAPGWYEDYIKITEGSSSWVNSMPARGLFAIANYNPIDTADKITCPVLIINGERDQGVPAADVRATAARIANCKQVELDFDHFDLYEGFKLHDEAVRLQVDFLREITGE